MSVSLINDGIICDEKQYVWKNLKQIVIEKSVLNYINFFLFNTKDTMVERFILDSSKPETTSFINSLSAIAKANGVVVVIVPEGKMVCRTCGAIVAKNAMTCPKCGHVFQEPKSGGLGFVGTVLAILVAVAIIAVGG